MWCVPWDWERCAWWTLEHDEGSSRCRQTKERVCRLAGCRHRLQGRGGGGGKDPKKFTDGTRTDRGGLPHGVSPVREAVPAPAPAPPALRLYGQLASPRRRPHGAAAAPHAPLTQAEGAADCSAGRTKTRCFSLASMSSAFELTQSSRTGGSETGPVSTWLGLGLGLG